MGLFDDELDALLEEQENSGFEPLDLCPQNVLMIFNRCLATEDSRERTSAQLFPSIAPFGYKPEDSLGVRFDTEKLLENKQNIDYLFGQLKEVHSSTPKERAGIDEFLTNYDGRIWTQDKAALLKFLLLGVTPETLLMMPFRAADNTAVIRRKPPIKPTLSPKDPNFPAWWEAHKAEWETPAE